MSKKKLLFVALFFTMFFTCKNVYAFDSSSYKTRELCGQFEVAGFHNDGYIDKVECFDDYASASTFMRNNGAADLAIMTYVNGEVKIIDANRALLDLTVNPEQLTYYNTSPDLTGRQYTYMQNHSVYRDGDGAFLGTGWSSTYYKWTARVRIADFTGWIPQEAYEIVPCTWIKSHSYYVVTNDSITHYLVTKIQDGFPSSYGHTIGPKPEQLSPGWYYSYDGHYFYSKMEDLMDDYKNNTYAHSVNANNPYYNYYQYLSNHTKTNYSSVNIDEYIRNNMGIKKDVVGNTATSGTSKLYGMGTFFYNAQQTKGINALLSFSLARNESGNGTSWISVNKNNGFGLGAVDSNAAGGAEKYPTFNYGINYLADHWLTYGFIHPRDGRYFGPQYGNKYIGMNVKYASDAYWSETMAAYYYAFDKAYGLQDYNFYQLGVVNQPTDAYIYPEVYRPYFRYQYPEAEDAVVIVGEINAGGELWYKVVSDLNLDDNLNEKSSGDYNWNNSYVYVKASNVKKINQAKSGYKTPNNAYEYADTNYKYITYDQSGTFTPQVGQSTKNADYYFDSSLTQKQGTTLLKDRYVIIYAQALLDNHPVAYLVTSDYYNSQRHWVSADSISVVNIPYGEVTVNSNANEPLDVVTESTPSYTIGGLHDFTYVPLLSQKIVNGVVWYKVPVSLTSNSNIYGYVNSYPASNKWIEIRGKIVTNHNPVISAEDLDFSEGEYYYIMKDVTAYDEEDGDLTSSIIITAVDVDTMKAGTYHVTYEVRDSAGGVGTKTITIRVSANQAPTITASDKTINVNDPFDPMLDVTATDKEDGDLTSSIVVKENTVDVTKAGTYKVVYEVTDSKTRKTTKEIKVTVKATEVIVDENPVITATDKTIKVNDTFDPKQGVTATDKEDGDLTSSIKVTTNNVDVTKAGTYSVTYEVTDSGKNKVTKTITVTVEAVEEPNEPEEPVPDEELQEKDGEFSLENIKKIDNLIEISGSLVINNIDNVDKSYTLVLINKQNSNDKYEFKIQKWTEGVPYNIGVINGKDYKDSWFKDKVDLSSVPNGDYDLYMKATSNGYVTSQLVDNFFNQPITKRINTSNRGYNFNVINDLTLRPIELQVRNKVYTTSQAPTFRTMVNEYEKITFKNDKLYIQGYSYNYGGTYNSKDEINRKIIFENINSFEQQIFEANAIKGPYKLVTKDNKDKTYAWYEKEIDIAQLSKGTYNISVYTKTVDSEDFGELTDMFKIASGTIELDGKTYTIRVNKNRFNRIELVVE